MDTSPHSGGDGPDLRSRKRSAAIRHIQRVALSLFDEYGYDEVSVTQIAEAAEVGERSIYRYFGTMPMLLLYDEADVASIALFSERLESRPLLAAVTETLDDIGPLLHPDSTDEARRRLSHVDRHPELRAALASYVWELGDQFAQAIAAARRVPADDLTAQVHGHCVVAALTAAINRWRDDPGIDLHSELRAAVQILADGLTPPSTSPRGHLG